MNPRRPHPYQISDSTYAIEPCDIGWVVVERWDHIGTSGDREDCMAYLGEFTTPEGAMAWIKAQAG